MRSMLRTSTSSSPTNEGRESFSSSDADTSEVPHQDDLESPVESGKEDAMVERAKYIPLRLTAAERTLLGVMQGALSVSEYTDNVDISSNNYYARQTYDKSDRVISELNDLCQIVLGVGICNDFKSTGSKLVSGKKIADNAEFLQTCMEIGRRYKIMNPDKMRSTYGKLLYVLMDSASPRVHNSLGFSLRKDLVTVYSLLRSADALDLIQDPNLQIATRLIMSESRDPVELKLQREEREKAIEELVLKYSSTEKMEEKDGETRILTPEDIKLVVNSIADNNNFLVANRDPISKLIKYLKEYFDPKVVPDKGSLEIRYGKGGSKLSHSHSKQYEFVLQSLTLWQEIMSSFFKLWCLAEADLIDERNGYRLCNTGQGLQRCQAAPRVSQEMAANLRRTKAKVGSWVGLSVVHLGDRDVPNALTFIDKYTQVPRILGPLVQVLDKIDELAADPELKTYIETNFGDARKLRKLILCDYFRHGFDGSGDDGGSCIDGRLTSNWNWCSKLDKKSYYPIFLFAGFVGFDGDFRE